MSRVPHAIETNRTKERMRRCLSCGTDFLSHGPQNRICPPCGPRVAALAGGLAPVGGSPTGRRINPHHGQS